MANLDQIKLSGTTYNIYDSSAIHSLDGYYTSGQTNAAITAATAALAETIAEMHYQTSGDVQNAISGKADTSALTAYFGAVDYDSTTHHINFYNTTTAGTVMAYVDATDFIKDSFLESVTVEDKIISGQSVPCLVFVWNTESGIEEVDIPLTDLFDPSNYYNKSEVDEAISAATSGKVDTSAYTAYTAATDTALSGKQETLVSGTNIKTVDSNSLLGSGDIKTMKAQVSGTTLEFYW